MSQTVLLNNIHHQNTKVIAQYHSRYGDNVASVIVFPNEFVELQKEYPLFFRIDETTKQYQCTALFGLQQGENLFLNEQHPTGWDAHYVPALVERGPFLIGFQQQDVTSEPAPVIHIDMQHPKVNEEQGNPVFLEHGGNSPYLDKISTCLQTIHQGMQMQAEFFAMLERYELLEPVEIEYTLANGEQGRLRGNYTINEEKLANLNAEQLVAMNQKGFLPMAYAAVASLTNVRRLIDLKNRTLSH